MRLINPETIESIKVLGIKKHIWHSYLYRPFSILLHKFNLHHMQLQPIITPNRQDIWCTWCGARHTYVIDYNKEMDAIKNIKTNECQWCLGIGCQMCDATIKNITVQSGGPGTETNVIVEVWGNSRCDCDLCRARPMICSQRE